MIETVSGDPTGAGILLFFVVVGMMVICISAHVFYKIRDAIHRKNRQN
jgi:hypothetical protein